MMFRNSDRQIQRKFCSETHEDNQDEVKKIQIDRFRKIFVQKVRAYIKMVFRKLRKVDDKDMIKIRLKN